MNRLTEYTERCGAVSRRRCASRPTKIVPSSPIDTTDGTSASPLSSRMTTGLPSSTYATRLFVVPRSIPTTLPMGGHRGHLALNGRKQVVDVVPFEQALAKGVERRALLGR